MQVSLIKKGLLYEIKSSKGEILGIFASENNIVIYDNALPYFQDVLRTIAIFSDTNNKRVTIKLPTTLWNNQLNKFITTGANDLLNGFFYPDSVTEEFMNFLLTRKTGNMKVNLNIMFPYEWRRMPIKQLPEQVTTQSDNFIAFVVGRGKELIFEQSKRNRTPMLLFRQQPFNVVQLTLKGKEDALRGTPILIESTSGRQTYLLPVSRYAEGMSRGTFYGKSKKSFCGTFYYWEPNSGVFLNCGTNDKMYFTINKLTAAIEFSKRIDDLELLEVKEHAENTIVDHLRDTFGLGQTDQEILEDYYNVIEGRQNKILSFNDLYIDFNGDYVNALYALEDVLDQPICKAGKELGYNIIILSRMVGGRRTVTEILDVRDRITSFQNLAWEV